MDNPKYRSKQDGISDGAAFAARLRAAALEAEVIPAELARRTRTARQSMADYWGGKRVPSADRLFALADELQVSARWLLDGSDEEQPQRVISQTDDWVWVPRYDLLKVASHGRGVNEDVIHVDRNWLLRTFGKTDGIWFAEMPSDTLSDLVQRGETLVLEDVAGGLVEGRHYAFLLDGRIVVRRYDVVPGKIVLSGSNPGMVPITVEIAELGKSLVPVAHIIGAFSLRSF
mgnify:CR=1 FL=1